jgi:hypothetical protein
MSNLLKFLKLNLGWNAEPNAPAPVVSVDGNDVILGFYMNAFRHSEFSEEDLGFLRFMDSERYRLGSTNDEGWYRGQCRFGKLAPEWGELYQISGDYSDVADATDWHFLKTTSSSKLRHFLFYFRDNTFECVATECVVEKRADNALLRKVVSLPALDS